MVKSDSEREMGKFMGNLFQKKCALHTSLVLLDLLL